MILVKDWVRAFLTRHKARFGPNDWPKDGDEYATYVKAWITALACLEASEDEAEAASLALLTEPPRFRADHIPHVVREVKAGRERSGKGKAATRDDARAASAGCPYCGGEGLAVVYHPHPDPARRVPPSCAAHCVCPHGRYMRDLLSSTSEGRSSLRRVPDLVSVLNGLDGWLLDPPGRAAVPAVGT